MCWGFSIQTILFSHTFKFQLFYVSSLSKVAHVKQDKGYRIIIYRSILTMTATLSENNYITNFSFSKQKNLRSNDKNTKNLLVKWTYLLKAKLAFLSWYLPLKSAKSLQKENKNDKFAKLSLLSKYVENEDFNNIFIWLIDYEIAYFGSQQIIYDHWRWTLLTQITPDIPLVLLTDCHSPITNWKF